MCVFFGQVGLLLGVKWGLGGGKLGEKTKGGQFPPGFVSPWSRESRTLHYPPMVHKTTLTEAF